MYKTTIFAIFCLAVLLLTACQPVQLTATPQPTDGSSDDSGVDTPSPIVSSTVTPAPTTTSTLPIPTQPSATLPAIPTADFSPQDIIGMWTRSDPDRGDLYMIFTEGNTYTASHGTPNGVVHSGSFTLEGSLFTFLDGWNCSPKPDDTPGKFVLRLSGGRFLYFDLYEDTCPDRPEALSRVRWERVTKTPTPVP
jgi:hypothetical protein